MSWKVCLIFSLLFISCRCGEPLDCGHKEDAKTTMMKLKLFLLCGYDKYLRPVEYHTNKTSVGIIVAPRIIDFDDVTSTLRVKTWLSLNWKDSHLTWDKLLYDGIDQFTLDSSFIWVPDLSVYNAKDETDTSLDQQVSPVMIHHHGEVYAFMSPVLAGHCVPNWSNWPYDVHQCTLTLGSKRYLGSTVDFTFLNKEGLWLKYLLPNNEWELIKTNTTRNETALGPKNETDSLFLVSLNYDFTLRRHASVYVATYLIPGLVMVMMSLALLWIPPNRSGRMAILCTLVFLQSISLQYLSYKIPANGDTTPYLVCFFRDCLFLTGLLVIQTIVNRRLTTCTSNPSYLQSTFRFVASNKYLQVLLVNDLDPKNAAKLMDTGNDEGSTLVAADENVQQWQMFVNIIDRVCFVLLVPIYLLLSISLMPANYSFTKN
ncbi:5-hydroxytryptamine receptor 3A-like [Macrosteles quadrilineatus]|uniref:5-hydroxytryptamine receptor 3A-like n=1 Tax=Macrosteles quadrilineatus TaxID=74068 RepID=UPI0023E145B0|nr:5-hydroxytryptamine receptor 3A-like [Macrosteles quadrilineatus]